MYSARFSGAGATDRSNNEKLLALLKDVQAEKRTAKFVSVITMIYPHGDKIVARGECQGRIIFEERGSGGFGYDPLFVPDGYDSTFAELGAEEKNKISHRARALEILERELRCSSKRLIALFSSGYRQLNDSYYQGFAAQVAFYLLLSVVPTNHPAFTDTGSIFSVA